MPRVVRISAQTRRSSRSTRFAPSANGRGRTVRGDLLKGGHHGVRDPTQRAAAARWRFAVRGNSGRHRPSGVHDAQRPHRRHGRTHRLLPADAAAAGGPAASCLTAGSGQQGVAGPRCREEGQGSGHDHSGRVLQGGPGPSSSHTIGPMRITYDFYKRATKLPADQLAKVTGTQGASLRQPQCHG